MPVDPQPPLIQTTISHRSIIYRSIRYALPSGTGPGAAVDHQRTRRPSTEALHASAD